MNKFVYCDKCGHNFDISLSEIHKGDIIVQYLECPACKAKYHVCTTDTEMRRLIKKRLTILDKIAESREKVVPAGTSQKLQNELKKILTLQKKLNSRLKKCGEEILNSPDMT